MIEPAEDSDGKTAGGPPSDDDVDLLDRRELRDENVGPWRGLSVTQIGPLAVVVVRQ